MNKLCYFQKAHHAVDFDTALEDALSRIRDAGLQVEDVEFERGGEFREYGGFARHAPTGTDYSVTVTVFKCGDQYEYVIEMIALGD